MTGVDPERITRVTRRFSDLHGLTRCVIGVGLLAGSWAGRSVPFDGCAAAMASVLYVSAVPHSPADAWVPRFYVTVVFEAMGLAAIATGFLDHQLLVRTLPGRGIQTEETEHADPI